MDARRLRHKAHQLDPWQTRFHINGHAIGGEYEVPDNDLLIREFVTRLPAESRILELGCMEGGRTIHMAGHVNHVVAVDGRRGHLGRARFVQELLELDNVTFLEANLETFDLETLEHFDAIYNVGLLYHLPEPWVLLRKLSRIAPCMYLCPSRWDPDYVVWDYQRADSPGVHRIKPPAPDAPQSQEIRGSGFGCVVLRTDLLRRHEFSIPPGELYYDPYFSETVGDEWKRLCDWTCVCRHLTER